MRAGDLVRFKEITFHGIPMTYTEWRIGLLKEYHTWEKIATIIYNGKEIRVTASLTEVYKRAKRK